ncbi:MAG: hypothetical protein AB7E13_11760, partial [Arcobacteraceae bacterium]
MKTVITIFFLLLNCYANLQLPHAKETHGKVELKGTLKNEFVQIGYAIDDATKATEALKKAKDDYSKYK